MTDLSPAEARAARREFRVFLWHAWAHLGLPKPTAAQLDIARYLQRGPDRRVVLAFRGVGKSWIYSAYLAWRLWRQPQTKVLVVSATQGAAESLAGFSRRLIREMPALAPLRPRPTQRDGAALFDVGPARAAKDASVRAVGIGGQITGARADEILADDVETLNNAMTAEGRAKLSEQVREFDAVLRPGGRITVLGTPQTPDSLYPRLRGRGYALRVWPAEIPADASVYGGALAPMVLRAAAAGAPAGAPVDPQRFDRAELARRRLGYGASGYAMQFLLDTRPVDPSRRPLRLSDLLVVSLDPSRGPVDLGWDAATPLLGLCGEEFGAPAWVSATTAPYADAVLAVDPSGRGRDETGFVVLKALNGRLFLLEAGGLLGGYDEASLEALAAVAARQAVRRIVLESNFGDGMFGRLLAAPLARAGVRAALEEQRAHRAKEQRILAALEPPLAQRRLIVDRGVVLRDAADTESAPHRSLFRQMAQLTAQPGALDADDRIDALALAVTALSESLALDTVLAERRRLREEERRIHRAMARAAAPVLDRPGRAAPGRWRLR